MTTVPGPSDQWIRRVATDKTLSRPWMRDDATQEGMIAAWEAWQHRPGDLGYAQGAAKKAIVGYVTGHRKSFGHAGRRGWQETGVISTDPVLIPVTPSSPVTPDLAYHRRDIAAAVSPMTDRQKQVVFKVAFDQPMSASQRGEWSGRLRPRLASELAHLRDAA